MSDAPIHRVQDELCEYLASALQDELPVEVAERAKHHLLDSLAAMLSGSRLLPGQRAIEWVGPQGGTPEASVVGTSIVTTALNAVMANGMFGHADETDDANFEALIHPGCSIVPTALAMAERQHASGRAMLGAVVLGYDIAARMSRALGLEDFRKHGFSTHSIAATFGCATAAGALVGLNPQDNHYLLSYTAQQASGVACWAQDIEHVEKAFDFGAMPARAGITAATMVALGFTGVENVLMTDRGFFAAFDRFARPELLVEGLGHTYEVMNTSIKRWTAGYPIQAPLHAITQLTTDVQLDPSDIESIRVTIGSGGLHSVNRVAMGSIDLRHLMGLMLVDGDVTFESAHDHERVNDPDIAALRGLIVVSGSDELASDPVTKAILEIDSRTHGTLRHHTDAVRGTPSNPMDREDVEAKCRPLIASVLGDGVTDRLIEAVWSIEDVDDIVELRPLLTCS